uniref:plasmid mobilization protein n=1 Tax=Microscilla sp. PRE1 TaxID=155537 RepID=UPI00146A5A6B|nr:plasmid mobilization relaxosome protein MobC [Microscilla sp. PRE1]
MENKKNKKGRPAHHRKDKKEKTSVWMKKQVYEKLRTRAKNSGHSYSQYCEKILLTKQPVFYGQDHKQLIAEINKIGINFNQIVKAVNEHALAKGLTKVQVQEVARKGLGILRSIEQMIDDRTSHDL